jgi:outer membrane protein assembly factor BamA
MGDVQPAAPLNSQDLETDRGLGFFNDTSFLVVPVPVSNPTTGSGGALAAAMFFKTDAQSQSSLIGAAGFYTSNKSWGGGAASNIAFDDDAYHAKLAAGYADVNYAFYGIGTSAGASAPHVSLDQSGYAIQGGFEGRVAPHFYLGGQVRYMDIKTAFNLPALAGTLLGDSTPISNLKNTITTIGATANYDSRDRQYSPTSGQLINGEFDTGFHNFLNSSTFFRATAAYNRYDSLSDNLVLASHASLCQASGQVPIFDLCLFGMSNDLRGYAVGRYQDKAMFTEQEELRWHAFWRIGFVAFAGVGGVAHSVDKFGDLLASAGGGIRFLASKEYGVNIGLDGAITKDGQKAFYVQVGEAF